MARTPDGEIIGAWEDNPEVIGAGGWWTRSDAADDGTVVTAADAASPRILRTGETRWTKLFRPGDNFSAEDMEVSGGLIVTGGTFDVAICATDSDVVYWMLQNILFSTTDGGNTVNKLTALTGENAHCNDAVRMTGKPLAVDPENGDVVFFGHTNGVKYSTDGGANWTSISTATIPVPTLTSDGIPRRYCIAFDRNSAVVDGRTQGIYVLSNGNGLYRSTNGGSTWATVVDAPTAGSHMKIGANGYVHIAGNGTGGGSAVYNRWNGSAWITGPTAKSIAISQTNAGHIYLCTDGGTLHFSSDHGATWTSGMSDAREADVMRWHEWTNEGYMSNGGLEMDHAADVLWMFEGIGAWRNNSPPTSYQATVTWTEASRNLESMVVGNLHVNSRGDLAFTCQDRLVFVIPQAEIGSVYPSRNGFIQTESISMGGTADWAPGNNDFIVCAAFPFFTKEVRRGGISRDGGASWELMPGDITAYSGNHAGGNIIAFSETVFVQNESNKGKLMRTTDGGLTWAEPAGIPGGNHTGCHAYWTNPKILVKDADAPTTTAYLYSADQSQPAWRGIWKTTDAGANWTRIFSTYILGPGDLWRCKLVQFGPDDWVCFSGDNTSGMKRSTDGMVTWSNVTGEDDVAGAGKFAETYAAAVGKPPATGEPRPIMVAGFRAAADTNNPLTYDRYGYWLSLDNMATWTRVAQFPNYEYTWPLDMAACPVDFGRFYCGHGSQGVIEVRHRDRRTQT